LVVSNGDGQVISEGTWEAQGQSIIARHIVVERTVSRVPPETEHEELSQVTIFDRELAINDQRFVPVGDQLSERELSEFFHFRPTRVGAVDDRAAIDQLLADLASGAMKPRDALNPELMGETRALELETLGNTFKLRIDRVDDIRFNKPGEAEAQVQAELKRGNTTVQTTSTARFVKHGDQWYFVDFEFLRLGWFFWMAMTILAVFWATCMLCLIVLYGRLMRADIFWKDKNYIKMFIPFLWPRLSRLTRRGTPATA
jgi:hypothetical protein